MGELELLLQHQNGELLSRVNALEREIDDLRLALRKRNDELRECNHRVVNGLMIAAALMRMQLRAVEDATSRDILFCAAGRIEAMGRFHRHLALSESTLQTNLGEYIATAAAEIAGSTGMRCDVDATPKLYVDSPIAMTVALIINELVVNAKKHAYGDQPGGLLKIKCRQHEDGTVLMSVEDDGPGLPSNFEMAQTKGLGSSLVKSFVQQLGGTITTENVPGACFRITIPLNHRST